MAEQEAVNFKVVGSSPTRPAAVHAVDVAQLVELTVVVRAVEGSIPFIHPSLSWES